MIFHKPKSPKYEFVQGLITLRRPGSAASEAYRVLRTNMGFAGIERTFRTILFTSPNASDGKSTVISNLAVVMAQANYKILVLDCNLRKPVLHKIFNLSNEIGFTTCIYQNIGLDKVVIKRMEGNLSVVTSGPVPPDPAEILNSAHTRALWPSLVDKYDYIFIDSPSMLATTDAAILSAQADGSVLVVRPGNTRIDEARCARKQFARANARLIGVVLNKVKTMSANIFC
ncbi:MAG: CpsD/CapB family tyrosine-protein kinase [Syntrophomonadaceae bacterium]|jgi:protein-tyrosine kinase